MSFRFPIISRNVTIGDDAEVARAKADYPTHAYRFDTDPDWYVGIYQDGKRDRGSVYFVIDTYRNDPQHSTSSGYRTSGREFADIETAVAECNKLKNVRRRVRRVEYTGRFIGSDVDGGFCIENGYRDEVLGERRVRGSKWVSSGCLAKATGFA